MSSSQLIAETERPQSKENSPPTLPALVTFAKMVLLSPGNSSVVLVGISIEAM